MPFRDLRTVLLENQAKAAQCVSDQCDFFSFALLGLQQWQLCLQKEIALAKGELAQVLVFGASQSKAHKRKARSALGTWNGNLL